MKKIKRTPCLYLVGVANLLVLFIILFCLTQDRRLLHWMDSNDLHENLVAIDVEFLALTRCCLDLPGLP